ncbi:MAG TPA: urease accessory protein UreD [Acidiferrobacter sp.]|nr:urease accessory protein UreD [Acidiferrobacter sp.]
MRDIDSGWDARLFLRFAPQGERTILTENRHAGPLRVQRPFYPEACGRAHTYLLHPPGGFVGGDRQTLLVHCEADSRVLLTTPAAAKCYKSLGPIVYQDQTLLVGKGASLEWLPQETIVFDEARFANSVRVELHPDAAFLGWDIVCFGRPAGGQLFRTGFFDQRLSLWRAGRPLWIEHAAYEGGGALLRGAFGLGGHTVSGTFICTHIDQPLVERLRAEAAVGPELLSVTRNGDILIARYLGDSAQVARETLSRLWHIIRRDRFGATAYEPRIWRT